MTTVDLHSIALPPLEPVTDPRVLARMLSGKYIAAGSFRAATSGASFALHNPATGEHIADVPACGPQDIDHCVVAAHEAQRAWAKRPAMERGKIVAQAAAGLQAHVEELARLIALETGKAIRTEARGEATVTSFAFGYYAGLASELKGETVPLAANTLTLTQREPLGVVGAILPWNVPLGLMSVKVAPALVAGNAVVVKTAEEAPLAVLRAVQLLNRVLPPGLLSVISGDGPGTGAPLVAHPRVAKITFTGSVETGRLICRNSADKLIPVTLELGGKSPMIVMADADLERAVEGAVVGMRFTRQGQSCSASTRIYVHASLIDAFVENICKRVDAMTMGDPLDEATDIGTIISRAQFDKVADYVRQGNQTPGVRVVPCGNLPTDPTISKGLFAQPVLLVGTPDDSRMVREEIFGPVVCIMPFTDYEDALARANDSDYGLAATIWTRDLQTALDAANRLEAGYIQINQNNVAGLGAPYGGYKNSGLGKEFSLSAMVNHFTREKTIVFNMQPDRVA